jgi:predicted ester cyclase
MPNTHENVLRRLVEDVWNRARYDELDQLVTPNVANHDPLNPTSGLAPFRDVIKKYRAAFPDLRQDIDDLFSVGDKAVARLTCSGTHRGPLDGVAPTGRSATVSAIVIARLSGDKIAEMFVNWDALGLMQQLGVVTMPGRASAAGA